MGKIMMPKKSSMESEMKGKAETENATHLKHMKHEKHKKHHKHMKAKGASK